MYGIACIGLLVLSATFGIAQTTPAAITTNNPLGATYQAILQDKNTTGIRGSITATSNSNGTGVEFQVEFFGFPDENAYGPFSKCPKLP